MGLYLNDANDRRDLGGRDGDSTFFDLVIFPWELIVSF